MKEMHLVIVSPERVIFDGKVSQVTLPGELGSFQVLVNHAPLLSSLVAGEVEYSVAAGTETLHIAGGFVDVNNNQVSVCVEI